ncbi:ATP-binding cassette domain-containing protein [Paenibacillus sp. SYP-B4298]|uniref:ATP-binding cassette domain-containing protein n=1 Tax=Paenibacillus sp. SYP-B4298 TaxID=2996034 RepID=UPI0022DD10B0|nr:dipeptide/oligopeptide/nickel ABC transporter ATP-binding protein [Paenibacillus sp. SYP-B4298]
MNELLRAEGLVKHYRRGGLQTAAVDGVSLVVGSCECVGIVGESGSGKSTLARLLLGLEQPDEGEVLLLGQSLTCASQRELRRLRQHVQVVFQDPTASLNERLPIWRSVIEPLDNFKSVQPELWQGAVLPRRARAEKLLHMVGLDSSYMNRYPHELSGGQRQRVCIARAISLSPQLLVCDEPTSSLDAASQSQIMQLLSELQMRLGLSIVFISHDLAAVGQLCDRIMVMYEGKIVDEFARGELWGEKRHPYTRLLIAAAL